jgi:type II restriction/modification system DNA methylase subunit YeeA
MNSKVFVKLCSEMNPTLNFQSGNIARIPYIKPDKIISPESTLAISKKDWNAYETSWDFTTLPLLDQKHRASTLKTTYQTLRQHWQEMTNEMKQLEEENNRIFIEAYGLQDELTPDVPLSEITLTCNPYYRYDADKPENELEALLLADTMREFISYAVGCMFGRYSLDQPGLILANQGETVKDYYAKIPNPTFPPDEDNVIPILDDDWFADDITEQFRHFLRVTFGEENYQENLNFIETALGKPIRKYFRNDFYKHHTQLYKKRPIYWLFSSPKGTFNALIYLHRYRPDTVSIVLNDYLREFESKLGARKTYLEKVSISETASKTEKNKAFKDIQKLNKILEELEEFDRAVLYPLATKQLEIDLDDGVKVNYGKFGTALKKIN